jgi:hypothetical protein
VQTGTIGAVAMSAAVDIKNEQNSSVLHTESVNFPVAKLINPSHKDSADEPPEINNFDAIAVYK